VLGVLLGLLVYAGIGRGLQPLKRLQAQLGDRSGRPVAALSPIELTQAPQEVLALAAAVNQLLEAVRRSLSQEKRFISDAAHQLRTPLAGLISQTELALQEHDPAALQERLSKVHAGALRSAHLVHQLLALARTEGEIQGRPLDMAALAREVAREWTPRALAAGVDLGYEGADSLSLLGEKLLLREALSNLIDNALHYAGRGATVTLRVRALSGQVLVEVEDNGPGLPAADRARVFAAWGWPSLPRSPASMAARPMCKRCSRTACGCVSACRQRVKRRVWPKAAGRCAHQTSWRDPRWPASRPDRRG